MIALPPLNTSLAGAPVSVFTFNDVQTGPIVPDPNSAFQTSLANQAAFPRTVRITSAPGKCLQFREVYLFDNNMTNVAFFKNATMSTGATFTDSNGVYTPAMGVDSLIDMDNIGGNMVSLPCDGSGWWQVDLGGVVNLTKMVFFNHFPGPASSNGATLGAAASGATVSFYNAFGSQVGNLTLNALMIQVRGVTSPSRACRQFEYLTTWIVSLFGPLPIP